MMTTKERSPFSACGQNRRSGVKESKKRNYYAGLKADIDRGFRYFQSKRPVRQAQIGRPRKDAQT